ncbi:MAG: iron(III) transport system permease protein, partial [Sphingomonadales bacterium]|nr:iron(III) transport system permease protein [Sphingomonadales bacterium]
MIVGAAHVAARVCGCGRPRVFLGITIAWLVKRTTVAVRGLIGAIVMVGYGFPSIILGVGVLLGYINVLYRTLTIILIAYVA